MGKPLWSDERIKQVANIEDPRRGNIVVLLKRMRDEYEDRIKEIEEQEVQHQISHQSYEEWEDEFIKKRKEYESNRNVQLHP